MTSLAKAALAALVLAVLATVSCAPSGFADPTVIQTVRILAATADKPYAKPGEEVTLSVLAYDGRPTKTEPMTIYWIPLVCENPTDDAYYACFQQFAQLARQAQAGDGGADAASGALDAGAAADAGTGGLTGASAALQNLPTGPSYTFRMPSDAVTSHATTSGTSVPYGLAIVFDVACAGHLQLVDVDPNSQNPQQVPIGCFDAQGHQVGADDWVLGFTRVYAYDSLENQNPVVSYVDIGGTHLGVTSQAGLPQSYVTPACDSPSGCLSMPHCTSSDHSQCQITLGPVVPSSSWEVNPEENDINGNPLHEEIWVDFYTTLGTLGDEARLLYDSTTGSAGAPSRTDTTFQAPDKPGTGTIWMVVHDNRGGAAFVTLPVVIQ